VTSFRFCGMPPHEHRGRVGDQALATQSRPCSTHGSKQVEPSTDLLSLSACKQQLVVAHLRVDSS
jgi:hypothetical protein